MGRPKGSRNKISRDALAAVKGLTDPAIAALRQQVEAGDMRAIAYVLDRVLPKGGRAVELDAADANAVRTALIDGDLTPSEAAELAQALAKLNEIEALATLSDRLSELEAAVAARPGR